VNYDPRQLFNVVSRMSPRERMLIGAAAFALIATSLYSFVFDPLTVGRAQLVTRASTKEKELKELVSLRTTYLDLDQKVRAGEALLSKADPNFALFTYLETTISQVIPRERINSMNPSSKTIGEQYEEQMVEIKLTQVSLPQLVDMLYKIEKSQQPLRVTRLQVKKRASDIRNFDITATVSLVKATS
jgi:type II secretory pathway component PulM